MLDKLKIFPVNVALHNNYPRQYESGLVYSESELNELQQFCKENKLYLSISYRNEELLLTYESSNNTQTTTNS